MTTNDILFVIDNINKQSGLENPIHYYLNGGCYIFAKKLRDITGGNLRYLTVEHHFVVEIDSKLYDASGNVTKHYGNSKYITEQQFNDRPKLCNSIKK